MLYKKKTLTWIVLGIIILALIGVVVYFSWPKVENKEQVNLEEEVQRLKKKLSSLRSEIDILSDSTRKDLLKKKLLFLEDLMNNFSDQEKQNKSTIKRLEKEIKKLKEKLKNDEPDRDPEPDDDENKLEVVFAGEAWNTTGEICYRFDTFDPGFTEEVKIFSISKDHPQIKKILNQGKIKESKRFTICYKKEDSHQGIVYTFSKFNEGLRIEEKL